MASAFVVRPSICGGCGSVRGVEAVEETADEEGETGDTDRTETKADEVVEEMAEIEVSGGRTCDVATSRLIMGNAVMGLRAYDPERDVESASYGSCVVVVEVVAVVVVVEEERDRYGLKVKEEVAEEDRGAKGL